MVSAAGVTLAAMSKIQSDFGSLADRVQTPSGAGQDVRHAWLDGDVPVLLVSWRRSEHGAWEGLVMGAAAHGPAVTWVTSARLRPVSV